MLTALDAPIAALDDSEQKFIANVREHGWFNTAVFGDDQGPNFSYTTGLWVNTGQPELIMFGMKRETIHDVFWDLFRDAKGGIALPTGKPTDRAFANLPAYAFPVSKRFYRDYLGWSRWFYGGDEFPCLHVVWPDRDSVFPWEPGFDTAFSSRQTDLTERGWKSELTG
jgi:hypothetical protein